MIGVYKITNPKGKIYIGSSKEIHIRFKRYKKLQCKTQPKLYNSLLKYGVENHIFEIIEECSFDELFKRESYFGIMFNVLDRIKGLNLVLPDSEGKKFVISEESKKRRSNAQLGKKASEETKRKQSKVQTGRKHSKETKKKMSLSNINSKLILDLETGIFYQNTKEASTAIGINRNYLKNMLNGNRKNKTSLIYC